MHQHHDTNEASAMSADEVLAELEDSADFREKVEGMPKAASRMREARAAVAALIAERDALAEKYKALYRATKRHAEAIQQCRNIESARLPYKRRDFLLEQARAEYSEASAKLWALIDTTLTEARNG